MKKIYKNILLIFSLLSTVAIFSYSCNNEKHYKHIVLSSDYKNSVKNWLENYDSTITIIVLYGKPQDSIEFYLKKADGIVITGGEDVNPALYGKDSLIEMCGTINTYRDSLEFQMINFALENKIPLLGICRGLQIMNVSQGGSLIVDIPTFIGDSIHRNHGHTWHKVFLQNNFLNADTGTVYSNHHQAIDNIAETFIPVAFAPDSIIEAIRTKDTTIPAFAIQWHPEAMDYKNILSRNIATKFFDEINAYIEHK